MDASVQKIFNIMGDTLRMQWHAMHYDEDQFPALADAALVQAQLHKRVTYENIIDHLVLKPDLDNIQWKQPIFMSRVWSGCVVTNTSKQ